MPDEAGLDGSRWLCMLTSVISQCLACVVSSGRTLGDGVVGKAPIMTICTWQYSGGVNLVCTCTMTFFLQLQSIFTIYFFLQCFETTGWLWRFGIVVTAWVHEWIYCTSGPVRTTMDDHLWMGKPPRYITSYPGQLGFLPSAEWEIEYQPKCSDALWLGSKSRRGSVRLWMHAWVAGKAV